VPALSSTCRPRPAADHAPTARQRQLRGLRRWRVLLAVLLLAGTAGCGVGPQAQPVPVEERAADADGTVGGDVSRPVVVEVFLVRGSRLAPVSRVVSHQPGIGAALRALSQPLSETERYRQLRSAVPASDEELSGTILGSVARVSMPPGFDRMAVREQVAAMGQLVYTVVANTNADRVQLYDGERPIPVPGGDGALLDRPVGRADYAGLAPVPPPTPVAR